MVVDEAAWRHQTSGPRELRLPVEFVLPLSTVIRNVLHGAILLAIAGLILVGGSDRWTAVCLLLGVVGAMIALRNFALLFDSERRRWVLDKDGIEIRYGGRTRRYEFSDYTDYRISRGWLGQFLVAETIESAWRLPPRSDETGHQRRSAILTPGPPLGHGAPATLSEWQSTLNGLRRAAIEGSGLVARLESRAEKQSDEEAERIAEWRALSLKGEHPSRLSRKRYSDVGLKLSVVTVALVSAPVVLVFGIKLYCGFDAAVSCVHINPGVVKTVAFGGPLLGFALLKLGSAWLMVRRAHDLDEDLSFLAALKEAMSRRRRSSLHQRLSSRDGTLGPNRFGPPPPD